MGYGDVLLAAGLAERIYRSDPSAGPVAICDCAGKVRWREEWAGNPAIRGDGVRKIFNGPGCSPWHPPPAAGTYRAADNRPVLYLTDEERAFTQQIVDQYGPYVLIEPTQPSRKNVNRFWPGWPELSSRLSTALAGRYTVLQLTRPEADHLGTIPAVPHPNFRHACAAVQRATLAVLPEGGLAIGAAAVNASPIVLWGGFGWAIEYGGFPDHLNVAGSRDRDACANSRVCTHCAEAWSRITVDRVIDLVEQKLQTPSLAGTITWPTDNS